MRWQPVALLGDRALQALDAGMRSLVAWINTRLARDTYEFYADNVAASQTSVELFHGLSGVDAVLVLRGAYVTAIGAHSNEARTAGTLSVVPCVDGTALADAVELNDVTTTTAITRIAKGLASYIPPGSLLSVELTTDASWAPTTADIIVSVMLEYTMED